jgi:hypothetical protein
LLDRSAGGGVPVNGRDELPLTLAASNYPTYG